MIEAVNSVVQSAPILRGNAEQTSTTDSFAANPARTQKVAQASYISPYYTVDTSNFSLVLEIRNTESGKVLQKIPSTAATETKKDDGSGTAVPTVQTFTQAPQAQQTATSAPAPANTSSNTEQDASTARYAQQLAAFSAAAQSGNSNAGNISFVV